MNSACKYVPVLLLAVAAIAVAAVFLGREPTEGTVMAVLPTIPRPDLVMRDKIWYKKTETNAFTGYIVETYTNGTLMARSLISNGLPNGVSETWYTNGQLQMREGFRNGISDGLRQKWFPNGRKMSEATLVDGKITGTFQSWHQNGQLAERIQMKDGRPDGIAWAYYPSGFAKAELAEQNGKVLNRKSWKDGEHKITQ